MKTETIYLCQSHRKSGLILKIELSDILDGKIWDVTTGIDYFTDSESDSCSDWTVLPLLFLFIVTSDLFFCVWKFCNAELGSVLVDLKRRHQMRKLPHCPSPSNYIISDVKVHVQTRNAWINDYEFVGASLYKYYFLLNEWKLFMKMSTSISVLALSNFLWW